jgi:hypothetical protein
VIKEKVRQLWMERYLESGELEIRQMYMLFRENYNFDIEVNILGKSISNILN